MTSQRHTTNPYKSLFHSLTYLTPLDSASEEASFPEVDLETPQVRFHDGHISEMRWALGEEPRKRQRLRKRRQTTNTTTWHQFNKTFIISWYRRHKWNERTKHPTKPQHKDFECGAHASDVPAILPGWSTCWRASSNGIAFSRGLGCWTGWSFVRLLISSFFFALNN